MALRGINCGILAYLALQSARWKRATGPLLSVTAGHAPKNTTKESVACSSHATLTAARPSDAMDFESARRSSNLRRASGNSIANAEDGALRLAGRKKEGDELPGLMFVGNTGSNVHSRGRITCAASALSWTPRRHDLEVR